MHLDSARCSIKQDRDPHAACHAGLSCSRDPFRSYRMFLEGNNSVITLVKTEAVFTWELLAALLDGVQVVARGSCLRAPLAASESVLRPWGLGSTAPSCEPPCSSIWLQCGSLTPWCSGSCSPASQDHCLPPTHPHRSEVWRQVLDLL